MSHPHTLGQKSEVFLEGTSNTAECIRDKWSHLFSQTIRPGDKVLIKPNFTGGGAPDRGISVHPQVVEAAVSLATEVGAGEITIAEDDVTTSQGIPVFQAFSLDTIAQKYGARLVDMKTGRYLPAKIANDFIDEDLHICEEILRCDKLISLTTLKTHHQAVITVALKNMYSNIPGPVRQKYHRADLERAIVAINLVRKADLSIIDGVIAAEGMGPGGAIPVRMDLALAGTDPVAIDAVAARLMGFDPKRTRTLVLAQLTGLGEAEADKIEVRGESIEACAKIFRGPLDIMREIYAGYIDISHDLRNSGYSGVIATGLSSLRAQFKKSKESFKGLQIVAGDHPGLHRPDDKTISVGNCDYEFDDHRNFTGKGFFTVDEFAKFVLNVLE
ncbi:MAG: DUF362 domain-containing protein [bacterium]